MTIDGILSFLTSGKQAVSVLCMGAIIWMAREGIDWKYCACVALVGVFAVATRAFTETRGKVVAVEVPKTTVVNVEAPK